MAVLKQIQQPHNTPPEQKRKRLTVNFGAKGNKCLHELRTAINARWNRSDEPSLSAVIDVAIQRLWVELGKKPKKVTSLVADLEKQVYPTIVKPTRAMQKLKRAYDKALTLPPATEPTEGA